MRGGSLLRYGKCVQTGQGQHLCHLGEHGQWRRAGANQAYEVKVGLGENIDVVLNRLFAPLQIMSYHVATVEGVMGVGGFAR